MAEIRQKTSVAGAKPKPKKPAKKAPLAGPDKLRQELQEARFSHSLQKLDSPAKLRTLRRELARALTREKMTPPGNPKENNGQ